MTATDPAALCSYTKRDLLLFVQLLHLHGLLNREALSKETAKLQQVNSEWFNHKCTELSQAQGLIHVLVKPTCEQSLTLYNELLVKYDKDNTTDLANAIYYERLLELDAAISKRKEQFSEILSKHNTSTQ